MLEEPFWLGLMTIAAVLVIIGLVWCVKRHFAEKLERFMVEELERGKLVDISPTEWRRGRRISNHSLLEPMLQSGIHSFSRPCSPHQTANINVRYPNLTISQF